MWSVNDSLLRDLIEEEKDKNEKSEKNDSDIDNGKTYLFSGTQQAQSSYWTDSGLVIPKENVLQFDKLLRLIFVSNIITLGFVIYYMLFLSAYRWPLIISSVVTGFMNIVLPVFIRMKLLNWSIA